LFVALLAGCGCVLCDVVMVGRVCHWSIVGMSVDLPSNLLLAAGSGHAALASGGRLLGKDGAGQE